MASGGDGAVRYTRTKREYIGGSLRVLLGVSLVVGVILGICVLIVNGVCHQFGYHFRVPLAVPVIGGAVVGLVAFAGYGWFLRPRPVNARRGSGDWAAKGGGRVWTGVPAEHDDGPRHRLDSDVTR